MDWRASDEPKLWRYNLHYFDYLHWPAYSPALKQALIDSWIRDNPVGSEDAWEPYPLSLRIVNWLKYWQEAGRGQPMPSAWLNSLSQQLAWQRRHVEYHLLANHLLVNGKALFFGGAFLDSPAAADWLANGLEILCSQADEQLLADGGHVERSFQYHSLVLLDYLDVLNLLLATPDLVDEKSLAKLVSAAQRGLTFLQKTRAGDGEIPLLNDSAFDIAPSPAELLDYGERVLAWRPPSLPASFRFAFPDTGYFGYRDDRTSMIIDCGPVGPDYQPGHAHCDTLSYELCIDGRRIIVDSGVFDYAEGEMRRYVRSTAAHNTVRVDGEEQSEIWGAFRVARRARPLYADLREQPDGSLLFAGAHDGYRRLPGRVLHRREIRISPARCWEVVDRLEGGGVHRVESYIHLHPDVSVTRDEGGWLLSRAGICLRLDVSDTVNVEQEAAWYCPRFGQRESATAIVLRAEGRLPLELCYRLERR